jgi:anti-anti-sigma factor
MSDELSVTVSAYDDGNVVVRPYGDLDLEGAAVLKRALQHVGQEAPVVVIDMAEVTFMDSTAISVLIAFQQQLTSPSGLRLSNLTPAGRRLLELTGLHQAFKCDDGVIDSFSGHPRVVWESQRDRDVVAHSFTATSTLGSPPAPWELSQDATTVVGIVSTALPFATTPLDQAERWLKALCRNGDAGFVLEAAGIGDRHADPSASSSSAADSPRLPPGVDPIDAVTAHAKALAGFRGDTTTRTTDLLQAVRDVYGRVFEEVLRRHVAEPGDVLQRLDHLLAGR